MKSTSRTFMICCEKKLMEKVFEFFHQKNHYNITRSSSKQIKKKLRKKIRQKNLTKKNVSQKNVSEKTGEKKYVTKKCVAKICVTKICLINFPINLKSQKTVSFPKVTKNCTISWKHKKLYHSPNAQKNVPKHIYHKNMCQKSYFFSFQNIE